MASTFPQYDCDIKPDKKYVVVTTISSFHHRYVIPIDQLQQLNTDVSIVGHEVEWAQDCVSCEEVKEFSQKHIGELIIDGSAITEEEMLELFNKDNDYLKNWTKEQKLNYVNNWKDK